MTEPVFQIEYYQKENGDIPFRDWLHSIRDSQAVERIRARLTRVRAGNFGNIKSLGDGVIELKIDYGPGYRVYYAMSGKAVVLLLIGGDKTRQSRDIETAKNYWKDYKGE
ncbi:MAG: type II toxin-antitoxin system RelE/ParE family toxin [Desulfuromonadaceae bacterium]|nr:type II toxin-antitoxin system RelE/ParE family toxin [Desulfuromonadaceae bacterium]